MVFHQCISPRRRKNATTAAAAAAWRTMIPSVPSPAMAVARFR
jgi:hypothetical protein